MKKFLSKFKEWRKDHTNLFLGILLVLVVFPSMYSKLGMLPDTIICSLIILNGQQMDNLKGLVDCFGNLIDTMIKTAEEESKMVIMNAKVSEEEKRKAN